MRTSEPDFEQGTLNAYQVRPDEVKGGDRFGYKVVAVVDEYVPIWRAYFGPSSWTDDHVARNGDALTEAQAFALFPALAATDRNYHG
jgi:hypothetical protein